MTIDLIEKQESETYFTSSIMRKNRTTGENNHLIMKASCVLRDVNPVQSVALTIDVTKHPVLKGYEHDEVVLSLSQEIPLFSSLFDSLE